MHRSNYAHNMETCQGLKRHIPDPGPDPSPGSISKPQPRLRRQPCQPQTQNQARTQRNEKRSKSKQLSMLGPRWVLSLFPKGQSSMGLPVTYLQKYEPAIQLNATLSFNHFTKPFSLTLNANNHITQKLYPNIHLRLPLMLLFLRLGMLQS